MIGAKFPNVDEDKLNDLAGHLRDFATGIDGESSATTSRIEAMGEAYQGASYQALADRWHGTSMPHVRRVTGDLGRAADIMDGAADFIRVRKTTAIGQLGLLAEDWLADQAAAFETGGLTEGLAAVAEAAASSFQVDQAAIRAHTDAVRGHADNLQGHVDTPNARIDAWSLA